MFKRGIVASAAMIVVNGDLESKLYASFYAPLSNYYTGDSSKPAAITKALQDLSYTSTTAMSFAQLVVFNKTCSSVDIPYFAGLSASVFSFASVEDEPSLTGTALSIGKLLSHAIASTVPGSPTANADLVSVFDAVLKFQSNLTNACESVFPSLSTRINQNGVVFKASVLSNPPLLPTASDDITSWVNFFRASSDLETQQVNLTGAPLLAAEIIKSFSVGYSEPSTFEKFVYMIENKTDLLPQGLVSRLESIYLGPNSSLPLNVSTAENIMGLIAYETSSNSFVRITGFALSCLNLSTEASTILSAFSSLSSADLTTVENVIALIALAAPNINEETLASVVELLYLIGGGLKSGVQTEVDNAKSGAFWLLSNPSSLYPSLE